MDLGSFGISLTDPLGGAGQDIVGWLGHSISQGIGSFASWSINGVIGAMQSTTTPDFTSWFAGPWRAMLIVVAWLSVPILFVGVGTAALRGDLTSVIKREPGAPVIMAIGTAVALPVTAGVLTLVNACCQLLVLLARDCDPSPRPSSRSGRVRHSKWWVRTAWRLLRSKPRT